MSEIEVLAVGKLKSPELRGLQAHYLKRLRLFTGVALTEIKDSDPEREGQRLRQALARRSGRAVALAEEGERLTSTAMAEQLHSHTGGWTFIIGGPHGLSADLKAACDARWSLSALTFPHELARILLLEQLYRAHTILRGTGYHHGEIA